jgi:acetyl-CoA carboxylase, biotin carboxylase subunit
VQARGTVEFLVDMDRNSFYFLEMNARIQVEHPVTEMITGIDIVAEQLAIAAGEGLRMTQASISMQGAAMECRINAEDPQANFMPSPGGVTHAKWPASEGTRVDTHIVSGSRVPPYYDSLLGKIIVHGKDRQDVIARMRAALDAARIDGVKTNLSFQGAVLRSEAFAQGGVDTTWLNRFIEERSHG